MRCRICDVVITTPNYSTDHEEYEPCGTCLAVIQDTVGTFGDRPFAAEDELEDSSSEYLRAGYGIVEEDYDYS